MDLTIPLKSLRIPGQFSQEEAEEGALPEVNDPVSFNVEAVVKSISGDNAVVDVRFINGERPGKNEATEKEEMPQKETSDEDLAKAAKAADEESYA
jgi:hypothetical protein